jgi:hypothetical protein
LSSVFYEIVSGGIEVFFERSSCFLKTVFLGKKHRSGQAAKFTAQAVLAAFEAPVKFMIVF